MNKGITLIALVITIIVMLILVAVTVNYGIKSGLLSKAKEGGVKQELEQERETLTAAVAAAYDALKGTIEETALGKELGTGWNVKKDGTSYTVTSPKNNKFTVEANGKVVLTPSTYIEVADLTSEVSSVSYIDLVRNDEGTDKYKELVSNLKEAANEEKIVAVIEEEIKGVKTLAPIPKGFTVSSKDTEQKISTGLVIYEGTGAVDVEKDTTKRNQFVWVPVPDVVWDESRIIKQDEKYRYTPMVKLQSGNTDNYEGVLYDFSETTSTEMTNYGVASTTGYREPAILADTTYAPDSSKRISNMQGKFDTMVASIKKYGGFYVGRYETTNMEENNTATVIAGTNAGISSMDWYTMYSKLNGIYQEDDPVKSEMIWGCQWDAMLNWMLTGADKAKVTEKTNAVHNRYYEDGPLNTGTTNSGKTDVINNVYDLEGNVCEWTQEAGKTYRRINRGGDYHIYRSPADRRISSPTGSGNNIGSRATLYIK